MSRKVLLLVSIFGVTPLLVVGALLMVVMVIVGATSQDTSGAAAPSTCGAPLPGTVTLASDKASTLQLTDRQAHNAATIIAVGKQLGVPPRGWIVALATARQESGLLSLSSMANPASLNYPYDAVAAGDHDSVGIFQQRDAWGSMAERMNVAASAKLFYTGGHAGQRGLLDIPGWQSMPIAVAAQSVQVSAFPSAYAQWESLATSIVGSLGNVDVSQLGGCADIAATGSWVWPVHPPYTLTAGFGECSGLWSHCHTGQDFAVPSLTPVHAVADGVVKFVGWNDAYGNLTEISHADGVESWYAHQTSSSVHVGQHVKADEVIGLSGATGNVTGPHVHLEIRVHDRPIDPMPFLHDRIQTAS